MHDVDTAADDPNRNPLVAARTSVAAIVGERDVVTVGGADATTFLQGQLSADVATLPLGGSTWSLLLEPQGRVDAWLRVWRTDDGFVLDVDAGWGERTVQRLQRFLLRVDVTLDVDRWRAVSLRGPDTAAVDTSGCGAVLQAPADWRGLTGVDLLGPDVVVPAGVAVLDDDESDALRVEQGWPAMGRELDESVIPAEAGQWLVDASVSFTKGCYTGQELVARIDSRGGNVPRRLCGVLIEQHLSEPDDVVVGAEVVHNGQVRGVLSSLACSPVLGGILGLVLLHRSVDAGASVTVAGASGTVDGRVVDLPVVPAAAGEGPEPA